MELILLINTALCLVACVNFFIAWHLFKKTEYKARAASVEYYLIADKIAYTKLINRKLILLTILAVVCLGSDIKRHSGPLPYIDAGAAWISFAFHIGWCYLSFIMKSIHSIKY